MIIPIRTQIKPKPMIRNTDRKSIIPTGGVLIPEGLTALRKIVQLIPFQKAQKNSRKKKFVQI